MDALTLVIALALGLVVGALLGAGLMWRRGGGDAAARAELDALRAEHGHVREELAGARAEARALTQQRAEDAQRARAESRDLLSEAPVRVRFLHVDAPEDVIRQRMARRRHFMPPALLTSQFATLEPLQPDEDGAVLPNDSTMEDLTERALRVLAED